ncbi:MAG: hypothetical protein IPL01_24750 [Acidobacteria bacterium]|nr:hypothetical protein [Acidobacteriota bacterium]
MNSSIEKELLDQLAKLAFEQQRMVLNFARVLAISVPVGTPGKELLRFAGAIELDDWNIMADAIQKDHEQINGDEW